MLCAAYVPLHLTAAGRNALEQIGRVARQHDDEICAALTLEESQHLNALLGRIADHQELTPGVHPGFRWLGRKSARRVAPARRA
jgi:hypothetical protein